MLRVVEREGGADGWIPAVVHRGLSARFLQDEALIGAEECMCGRVCSCLGDPALPFFTVGGSFVWGRVQSIADEFTPQALGNVRGRCILEGYDSIAILPLAGQNGPIGSLHLADFAPEKFSGSIDILEAACWACGPLLARHEKKERQRALLEAAEAALLPRELPQIPGLELAVAFTSATEMAQVGGDFYDAVALPSGEVSIFVGDYCGHGIEAAGMAARARHGISDLVRTCPDPDPAELLARANEFLTEVVPAGRFVTLVFCHHSGEGELGAAVAGHPRPLRLVQGGAPEEIVLPPNMPLGLDSNATFASETIRFSRVRYCCSTLTASPTLAAMASSSGLGESPTSGGKPRAARFPICLGLCVGKANASMGTDKHRTTAWFWSRSSWVESSEGVPGVC